VRLRTAIGLIKNTSLQRHYADAIAAMRRELFRPRNGDSGRRWTKGRRGFRRGPGRPARRDPRAGRATERRGLRLALILATLCRYPALHRRRSKTGSNGWNRPTPPSARWRCSSWGTSQRDRAALRGKSLKMATFPTLERLEGDGPSADHAIPVGHADDIDAARTCLEDELSKQAAAQAWQSELNEATHDLAENAIEEDSTLAFRLRQAVTTGTRR
jgi:DNA primase